MTGTVDSIPLIGILCYEQKIGFWCSSNFVRCKGWRGAFMKNIEDARELAKAMVDIGKENGRSVKAILTDMDRPLGHAIGNALEIRRGY